MTTKQLLKKYLPGWNIAEDISVNKKWSIKDLTTFTGLEEGEIFILGEKKLKRAKEKEIPLLGIKDGIGLYEEKGQKTLRKLYQEKGITWIELLGTVLVDPDGLRDSFCLCRDVRDDSWFWSFYCLDRGRGAGDPALVLASSTKKLVINSSSETLPLELEINGIKYKRV